MAHGGYEPLPEWDPYEDKPDDNDKADQTTTFSSNGASTPYQTRPQEEMEMKTFQEKSGRPETSYAETSFGGTEDLEKRLANLRRDHITGLLNTEGIPNVENPMSFEERGKEIIRVREFIRKRYPNADFKKLVISFSTKKPMDIVLLGPKGGETKIIKDNGSDFHKNFLNLTYVKRALGKSFQEIQEESNQQIINKKKELADLVKKSPEKKGLIDSLKEKISKKETEKKAKEREFYGTKLKSEKRKLKNKMKNMKKS